MLIAESGATKTDWRFVGTKSSILSFQTCGYNPLLSDPDVLFKEVKEQLNEDILANIGTFYFYGAGCASEEKKKETQMHFKKLFINAEVIVESDLLGSARSLYGSNKGVVAILGTGSSSCFYDGSEIHILVPSLGYILGDEGGGVDMGKELIKSYMYKKLPSELAEKFKNEFHLNEAGFIRNIYDSKFPNRTIASFSKFLKENMEHDFIVEIIKQSIRSFFENHLIKYKTYGHNTIRMIGSIAQTFNFIIREIGTDYGFKVDIIEKSAIEGLVKYHKV